MLRGPMQCAAILDDTGTGKTVSICVMICELASERAKELQIYNTRLAEVADADAESLGPKPTHRPVVVVAPFRPHRVKGLRGGALWVREQGEAHRPLHVPQPGKSRLLLDQGTLDRPEAEVSRV
jgi:hypothetical protein